MHSNWTRNVFKQYKITLFLIGSKSVEILLFSGAVKLQNIHSKYTYVNWMNSGNI